MRGWYKIVFLWTDFVIIWLCYNLTSSNYPTVQYFSLKLCTRFLFTNVYKRLSSISFILSRSWFINKNVKRPVFYALLFFTYLLITQDLNKIKENPRHSFVNTDKEKKCAKFQKKILNCRAAGARQISNFQTKYLVSQKQ